tara:strand:- start:1406 stop:1702 length:297 start_codon:yes stop_codon:yes gene_type:complete
MSDNLDVLIARALTNIDDDRATTEELLSELKDYLSVSKDRYAESGTVAAKLVETLQRSNEQLVKLAAIVHKKEATKSSQNLTELDKDELFDIIQSGGE